MKKFLAFTLAETLIVMGVIGIVSALTLPNLNSSTGDKERVAKVKKIYRDLNDAFGRAEAVYGPLDDWFINDGSVGAKTKRAGERITEFMKTSKVCGSNTGCFQTGVMKWLNGDDYQDIDRAADYYKFITTDGSSISIFVESSVISFNVDIDGPTKGKNTYGQDLFIFEFEFTKNTLVPAGQALDFNRLLSDVSGKAGCAATWIINYDNADYLKLGSDGKCPNGTTPTEANPRCK